MLQLGTWSTKRPVTSISVLTGTPTTRTASVCSVTDIAPETAIGDTLRKRQPTGSHLTFSEMSPIEIVPKLLEISI